MESDGPGVKSRLYHFEAVWPYIYHLTSLSLSSLIYRTGMKKHDLQRILIRIQLVNAQNSKYDAWYEINTQQMATFPIY